MPLLKVFSDKGITMMEIVVVVAVIVLIFAAGLPIAYDFYRSYRLNVESETVVSALRRAQNQAMNNLNQSPHGFFAGESDFVVFEGNSYALRAASLDQFFPRSGIAASGLSEIVFEPLSGRPSATGTIVLTNGFNQISVSINEEGRIEY